MTLADHEPQGGALDGRCPWYVERAEDRTVFEALCRRESCFVLTSHQMGKTSLIVRLLGRLRDRGVAAVAIDLAALGRDPDAERWHDTVCLQVAQKLGVEDEVEAVLAAASGGAPAARFQAALDRVILPRFRDGFVLLIDEINILRSLPFDTDPFLALLDRVGASGGGLTPCCFSALPRAVLVRAAGAGNAGRNPLVVLDDFRPWELLAIVERLARCVAEHRPEVGVLGVEWIGCVLAWLLQRVYYWTHGHPYLTQRLASRALDAWISLAEDAPETDTEDVTRLVDRLAVALFFPKPGALPDPNLALVRDRLLESFEGKESAYDLQSGVRPGLPAFVARGWGAGVFIERMLHLGVMRVEGGTVRWRNRIYERAFGSEPWAKCLLPGSPAGAGATSGAVRGPGRCGSRAELAVRDYGDMALV